MFHTSNKVKRLLVGAAALGVTIGGGVSAAGAASMTPSAGTAAHHVQLDPKSVKESESALEATTQDHKGEVESAKSDVTSPDRSGSTADSSSRASREDSNQGTPAPDASSPDLPTSGSSSIG